MHFISHIALATLTLAKCYKFFCPLSFAFQYCNVFTKGYLDKTKHGAVISIFVSMFRLKPLALFGRVKRNFFLVSFAVCKCDKHSAPDNSEQHVSTDLC